jgi:DNA primase
LGTERKTRKAVETERDGYKAAFEKVAGLYEFDEAGQIKGLNRTNLQKTLDQHGLEVVAKGQRQVQAKSGQKYDSDLIAEVVGTLGVDAESLKEMDDEAKLGLITQNLDAALDLRDKQKARNEQGRVQAEQVQAKFQQEMQVAAAALAKAVPHFKELQPVMEAIYQELTQDQSGTRFVQTLHELAEFRRLRQGGLRSLADKAKTSERTRILKALTVLGLKPADMEAVLAGKKPEGSPSTGNGDDNWIGS